jgi:hypothetical protein
MTGSSETLLKARIATYWRYDKQCTLVAIEASSRLAGYNAGGQSDVLCLDRLGTLIETEIKQSISDLRHDREKEKHYHFYLEYFKDVSLLPDVKGWRYHRRWLIDRPQYHDYPISEFYFAVPEGLEKEAKKAMLELFPYAGLLVVKNIDFYSWDWATNPIGQPKHAHHFDKAKLTDSQLLHLQKEMSATICRLSRLLTEPDIERVDRTLEHVIGFRA